MKNILLGITTIKFNQTDEFEKELKKFAKKYRSILEDLEEFKKALHVVPEGNGKHFNVITQTPEQKIIKARFFCKYLKGSTLRIVYAYNLQTEEITFIEVYFKGEKENEDRRRIERYLE